MDQCCCPLASACMRGSRMHSGSTKEQGPTRGEGPSCAKLALRTKKHTAAPDKYAPRHVVAAEYNRRNRTGTHLRVRYFPKV
eukprot:scaffold44215_cov69-Phaeocystis_antarctica.AAC.4